MINIIRNKVDCQHKKNPPYQGFLKVEFCAKKRIPGADLEADKQIPPYFTRVETDEQFELE